MLTKNEDFLLDGVQISEIKDYIECIEDPRKLLQKLSLLEQENKQLKEKVTTLEKESQKYQCELKQLQDENTNSIHRDLKPTNILIDSDGTIKICDFGISKLMSIEEQSLTRGLGTQKFMAPEIINEDDDYNEKANVYSFGVVLYFILSNGELPKIKIFDIPKGKKAEIPSSFTEFAKKLIYDCWNLSPDDRPSFSQI